AVSACWRVAEPVLAGEASFAHGLTFGGHPVQAAIALANLEVMRRERMIEGVREREQAFFDALAPLLDLPIVGDLRGAGFFWALELVKDKDSRGRFRSEERRVGKECRARGWPLQQRVSTRTSRDDVHVS